MMSDEQKQTFKIAILTLIGSLIVSAVTTTYTVTRIIGKVESDLRNNETRVSILEAESAVRVQEGARKQQFEMDVISRLARLETKVDAKP